MSVNSWLWVQPALPVRTSQTRVAAAVFIWTSGDGGIGTSSSSSTRWQIRCQSRSMQTRQKHVREGGFKGGWHCRQLDRRRRCQCDALWSHCTSRNIDASERRCRCELFTSVSCYPHYHRVKYSLALPYLSCRPMFKSKGSFSHRFFQWLRRKNFHLFYSSSWDDKLSLVFAAKFCEVETWEQLAWY
jgi:hypothetical protein